MNKESLITIIIPVFNTEKFIFRCINSILNQTYKNFELLIIDDGSTDQSGKICDEFAKIDKRIIVIHKKNTGVADTRNYALDYVFKNSNSDWITWIDSDDWIHKDYLKFMYNACIGNNTLIAACDFIEVFNESYTDKNLDYFVKNITPEMFYVNNSLYALMTCTKFYKKELLKNKRFLNYKVHEDTLFSLEVIFSTNKISYIDNILYYYYKNPNSLVHSQNIHDLIIDLKTIERTLDFFYNEKLNIAYKNALYNYCNTFIYILQITSKEKKEKVIKDIFFNSYDFNLLDKIKPFIIFKNLKYDKNIFVNSLKLVKRFLLLTFIKNKKYHLISKFF